MKKSPETCPNCGAALAPKAKACPECGSCEETGWSEDAYAQSLGLPDDNFDHDEFVKSEFGEGSPKTKLAWYWWLVTVGLLGGLLFWLFWRAS